MEGRGSTWAEAGKRDPESGSARELRAKRETRPTSKPWERSEGEKSRKRRREDRDGDPEVNTISGPPGPGRWRSRGQSRSSEAAQRASLPGHEAAVGGLGAQTVPRVEMRGLRLFPRASPADKLSQRTQGPSTGRVGAGLLAPCQAYLLDLGQVPDECLVPDQWQQLLQLAQVCQETLPDSLQNREGYTASALCVPFGRSSPPHPLPGDLVHRGRSRTREQQ